jgi:hypothetical protein
MYTLEHLTLDNNAAMKNGYLKEFSKIPVKRERLFDDNGKWITRFSFDLPQSLIDSTNGK